MIQIGSTLIPLHILLLDQPLNVLLNVPHIQHTSALSLLDHLGNQFCMCNRLSALHDSDNRRLGLELSVCGNALVRFFVLGFGLAGLDLVDFDAILGMRERGISGEGVGGVDIFTFRRFREDTVTRAGEGLERAL